MCKQMSTLMSFLLAKPLHSKYITLLQSDRVDRSGSTKWLQQQQHLYILYLYPLCLRYKTRSLPQGCIRPRSRIATFCMHVTAVYRVCEQAEETILHLLSTAPH